MLNLLLATVLVLQLPPADPAGGVPAPTDAYKDAVVHALVNAARGRRALIDREIAAYEALAKERISIGLNTPGRERLMYREESVARIRWTRAGPDRIEMLGARAVAPILSAEPSVPDPPVHLIFDLGDDRLIAGLGGREFLRHPFAPGSEADYRFRGGDSTGVRLPDGEVIRLREIAIEPRRNDPRLVAGSIWIELESHAVVRANLRPVRPFDLWAEARAAGDDDERQAEGRRRYGGDGPIQGEIRQISVEYALWDGEWWLPATVVFEGEARVGGFLAVPLRIERSYDDYRVEVDPAAGPPSPRADVLAGPAGGPEECQRESERCYCRAGRCRDVDIDRPGDEELLGSAHFDGSIYDGDGVISDREWRVMEERLRELALPRWQLADPGFDWRFARGGLVRYNRVEGVSIGARGRLDLGRAAIDGTARYGISGEILQAEVGAAVAGVGPAVRFAAYRRLAAANPATRPFGAGNSLMALAFGRDDGEYFLARGVEIRRPGDEPNTRELDWRVYAERQSAVEKATDFSFRRRLGGDVVQRDNIAADPANQYGLAIALRGQHGLDPGAPRLAVEIAATAEAGSYDFVRPGLVARIVSPLGSIVAGALELAAGTTFGESPVQAKWFLGGPATLRGFSGSAAHGDAYWRARGELATAAPGARGVIFGDVGWAGDTDEFTRPASRPLVGVGAGVGLLDGLIRFDVSRAVQGGSGWRADLYLDGVM